MIMVMFDIYYNFVFLINAQKNNMHKNSQIKIIFILDTCIIYFLQYYRIIIIITLTHSISTYILNIPCCLFNKNKNKINMHIYRRWKRIFRL